jgi:hypothetical protein
VSITACSSSGGDPELSRLVSKAVSNAGSSTSKMAMDLTLQGGGIPGQVKVSASGAQDHGKKLGDYHLQVSAGDRAQQFEMRIVDEDIYLRVPGEANWQHFDAATVSGPGSGASDPTAALDYLRGVSGSVEEQGTEKVRGTETRKLHADVDVGLAAQQLQGVARRSILALQQLGVSSIPVDVWIDDQGRLRREFATLDIQNQGQQAQMTITIELFDYGVPVDVQAPPEKQVVEGDPSTLGGSGA